MMYVGVLAHPAIDWIAANHQRGCVAKWKVVVRGFYVFVIEMPVLDICVLKSPHSCAPASTVVSTACVDARLSLSTIPWARPGSRDRAAGTSNATRAMSGAGDKPYDDTAEHCECSRRVSLRAHIRSSTGAVVDSRAITTRCWQA